MEKIPGFSDYAADEDGNIYTRRSNGGRGHEPFGCASGEFRLLGTYPDQTNRYLTVRVGADGTKKRTRKMVHTLVALTFLGPRPLGMQIAHGTAGRRDNSVVNLSYKTPSQNKADEIRDGTRYSGERHHQVLLSSKQWSELLTRLASGETRTSLGREYGVSRQSITRREKLSARDYREWAGALEGLILGGHGSAAEASPGTS